MPYLAHRWAPRIVILGAVAMLPWMVYLGVALPDTVPAQHWRLAWLGLDLAGLGTQGATWWLSHRRDRRALPVAIMNATLVAAKTWFGMSTSHSGHTLPGPLVLEGAQLWLAAFSLLLAAAPVTSTARPGRWPHRSHNSSHDSSHQDLRTRMSSSGESP
ncbi:hypothetical protein [Kitasatospora sp. MAP5-34]|uniref:hypothetical protein n=1 Tax=Kitasatospora sp. MAP5-34 TaxID=3035102 RepID=UPI002476B83F|nr:hypothetical protein [Kitasatospora sp. MAP5-34]MDH6580236.1 hypothetical protein [Kitasatospora sp. MAP5-34]